MEVNRWKSEENGGIKAAEFVSDGTVVDLEQASTACYFVEETGRRIKEGQT